jgi:hypothetical protein
MRSISVQAAMRLPRAAMKSDGGSDMEIPSNQLYPNLSGILA